MYPIFILKNPFPLVVVAFVRIRSNFNVTSKTWVIVSFGLCLKAYKRKAENWHRAMWPYCQRKSYEPQRSRKLLNEVDGQHTCHFYSELNLNFGFNLLSLKPFTPHGSRLRLHMLSGTNSPTKNDPQWHFQHPFSSLCHILVVPLGKWFLT